METLAHVWRRAALLETKQDRKTLVLIEIDHTPRQAIQRDVLMRVAGLINRRLSVVVASKVVRRVAAIEFELMLLDKVQILVQCTSVAQTRSQRARVPCGYSAGRRSNVGL